MTTERAGTVGAHWETELRRYETVTPDDRDGSPFGWDDPPTPNRAARRQAARDARRNR
ncbi:hypothetical protein OG900_33490 [Streptomyces sp. NBC_00433]